MPRRTKAAKQAAKNLLTYCREHAAAGRYAATADRAYAPTAKQCAWPGTRQPAARSRDAALGT